MIVKIREIVLFTRATPGSSLVALYHMNSKLIRKVTFDDLVAYKLYASRRKKA